MSETMSMFKFKVSDSFSVEDSDTDIEVIFNNTKLFSHLTLIN
jgi:hypothetical protein